MSIFKKLFAKPEAPKETPQITKYGDLKAFMVKGADIQIQEPWTLAQARLEGRARDRGAEKGLALYKNHKTRVQNQWINPMTSTNSGYSAVQNSVYLYQTVNYYECYILAQDPIFTKAFNKLSKTPFSKGGELVLPEGMDPEQANQIEKAALKYHLWDEVREAVRSEYVTGGCLLYLDFGQDADELMEPLDLGRMNMRKFKGFRHIDPINVTAVDVNTVNPSAPDYMKPKLWYVIGLGTVHASHFIKFEENVPELPMRPLTLYFGMPLTQLIKQDVANSNLVSQGVANLINRFRYIYMKVEDSAFVTNNAQQLRDKLEFMSSAQDNFGVCPLKQTEDVQQLTTSLAGLSENVEQCYLLLSAKTDIPYTELMGKSAQGMDATGEGDRRAWYDKCRNIQSEHKQAILVMYGIVAGTISDNGKFVVFEDYTFNPLEEATEKELAENIKAYTDVATALAGLGASPDSLVEWLKQFKQFHLDSIEFDTSTPGLEGYDDENPDDDPNGGGMPKITSGADIGDGFKVHEDITPKVLEAIKAIS